MVSLHCLHTRAFVRGKVSAVSCDGKLRGRVGHHGRLGLPQPLQILIWHILLLPKHLSQRFMWAARMRSILSQQQFPIGRACSEEGHDFVEHHGQMGPPEPLLSLIWHILLLPLLACDAVCRPPAYVLPLSKTCL